MSTATEQNINHWTKLLANVETNNGVVRVSMVTLRELEGRQRVGKHILNAIEEKLNTLGLGHLPKELPNRQQQQVVLYKFGTPIAELIDALQAGKSEPVSETTYQHMHRFNSIPDPDSVVARDTIGERLEETAQSVLQLLQEVRPNGDTVASRGKATDPKTLGKLIGELSSDLKEKSTDSDEQLI